MDKELLETPAETKGKKEKTVINPKQLYAITQTDLARFINSERENGTGAKQLLLYFFYQLQGNIQKTNQPKAVNSFVRGEKNKSGLGRSNETINKIRKELETPTGTYKPLITPIKQKNPKGQITGHYIKINYPIKATYEKEETVNNKFMDNTTDLIKDLNTINNWYSTKTQRLLQILNKDFWLDYDYINWVINSWKWGKHYMWKETGNQNYKSLTLQTILNLCCYIKIISNFLHIKPQYNKDTIRGLHRCLFEIRFYKVLVRNFNVYENLLRYFIEWLEYNGRDIDNIKTFTDLMIQEGERLTDRIKTFNYTVDMRDYKEAKWYLKWYGTEDYKLVLLSPMQHKDLVRIYGNQKVWKCIDKLNDIILMEYAKFYGLLYVRKNTNEIGIPETLQNVIDYMEEEQEDKEDLLKYTNRLYWIANHYLILNELLENDKYKTVDILDTDYIYSDKEDMEYIYNDDMFFKENPDYY